MRANQRIVYSFDCSADALPDQLVSWGTSVSDALAEAPCGLGMPVRYFSPLLQLVKVL
jgi:hypothetical protein